MTTEIADVYVISFHESMQPRGIVVKGDLREKACCGCTTSFSHFEAIITSIKYEASYLSGVVVDGQAVKPLSEVAASVSACASSRGLARLAWPTKHPFAAPVARRGKAPTQDVLRSASIPPWPLMQHDGSLRRQRFVPDVEAVASKNPIGCSVAPSMLCPAGPSDRACRLKNEDARQSRGGRRPCPRP